MTDDVLRKLEDAFINAFTDEMACLYAGISTTSLYEYCQAHPKFAERKELLKTSPNLIAQKTLVGDLTNVSGARWWAERTMKHFKPKSEVELVPPPESPENAAARKLANEFEEKLRAQIVEQRKEV